MWGTGSKYKMDLKKIFVIGTAGFVLVCLGLFYVLTNSPRLSGRSQRELNFENMEKKLQALEDEFQSHKLSMKQLEAIAVGGDNNKGVEEGAIDAPVLQQDKQGDGEEGRPLVCSSSVDMKDRASSDINMLDVYDLLKFDNPNGGVWKQGWDVKVKHDRFSETNKLKVFVIPHSHNDPGWIKTFEKYYQDQTKHILDSMLRALRSDSSLKFIWAEISYFSLWWNDISVEDKKEVQRLVNNKQLEFVTGGWVMPDESSSHIYSILLQLVEGHQWLSNHLNCTPKNGWSIDPFGMSPTMAYVLRRSGFSNMLIQRTHYSVKKYLAQQQELEFHWRQMWDSSGTTDIMCHMMPFYSYDVPHSCGPDPKICCQFDFKRMRGVSTMSCPWNVPPQPIVAQNVRERSETLLDQYRKKAMLYKSNVLLVPLGDDFRWEDKPEWDAQTSNYQKIFDYINSQTHLNAEVRFGTLNEYFEALEQEIHNGNFKPNVLSGDFFTYSDRDDHYWSGYFTSRPFHKAMDRELIGHLKSAQILFSMMLAESAKTQKDIGHNSLFRGLFGKLIKARRNLSLFQHHDGVAGTSKDHVMVDYAEKLHAGLTSCNDVMQTSLHVLTHLNDPTFELDIDEDSTFYDPVFAKDHHHSLATPKVVLLDHEVTDRLIAVFNPSAHLRTELVTVHVSTYHIKVLNVDGDEVEFELFPIFEDKTTVSINRFKLVFIAHLQPLSVGNFIIKHDQNSPGNFAKVYVKNSPSSLFGSDQFQIVNMKDHEEISLSNSHMTVNFGADGFAKNVVVNDRKLVFEVGMFRYGVKNRPETSGLYLFIPDGEATPINNVKPFVRIVEGKLMSYVEVIIKQVKHKVTLHNSGFEKYAIDVTNIVDIREESNFELMMRFTTNVQSGEISYTDLNGFQMIRRKRFDKLPLQGNYYPLPSATYIEDDNVRMTVLSRQPLGTASLSEGEIEVMMDRRLMQDDNRGAGQGERDNMETLNGFRILFEEPNCEDPEKSSKAPMLSLAAHLALEHLLHPLRAFSSPTPLTPATLSAVSDYRGIEGDKSHKFGCDIEIVDFAILSAYEDPLDDHSFLPSPSVGLTMRRFGFDGRFLKGIPLEHCSTDRDNIGKFTLHDLFGNLLQPVMTQSTLSFTHNGKNISASEPVLMKPMEIYAFKTFLKT